MLCKIKFEISILPKLLDKWLIEALFSVSINYNHYKGGSSSNVSSKQEVASSETQTEFSTVTTSSSEVESTMEEEQETVEETTDGNDSENTVTEETENQETDTNSTVEEPSSTVVE